MPAIAGLTPPKQSDDPIHNYSVERSKSVTDRMRDRLQRYHLADNFEHQSNGRHAQALAVVRRLRKCDAERRFGHLLGALQISDAEIADVLHGLGGVPAAPCGTNGDMNGHAPHLNGAVTAPELNGHGAAPATNGITSHETRPAMLARLAIDHWIETVRKVANSAVADRRFKMDRQ